MSAGGIARLSRMPFNAAAVLLPVFAALAADQTRPAPQPASAAVPRAQALAVSSTQASIRVRLNLVPPPGASNPVPVFAGSCANAVLRVSAPGHPDAVAAGTGDPQTRMCDTLVSFSPGAVTAVLRIEDLPGARAIPVLTKSLTLAAREMDSSQKTVEWPIEPTAVVRGGIEIGDTSLCPSIKVTVKHPKRTFQMLATTSGPNLCDFFFNWVPAGPVAISLDAPGWPTPGPYASRSGTVVIGHPLDVSFPVKK